MKRFCEIEQSKLKAQLELISNFEQIVDSSSSVDDINLYIDQEKQPELTHKYTNALELLDIVYNDRSIQESEERQISVVENDIKNLVVHSSVDSASANQHNSEIESPVATAILMKSLKSIGTEVVSANLEDDLVSAMNDEGVLNESVEDRELSANEQLEFLNDEISSKAMVLRAIMHQVLVTNDTKESSIMSEDEWRDMLSQQELRDVVLQELDEQRGRHSLLKSNSYESLTNAMKVRNIIALEYNNSFIQNRLFNVPIGYVGLLLR